MDILRTPEGAFDDLADFPFSPNYVRVGCQDGTTLRVHYVDEGPRDAPPVLMLHGEPSWSFLYRNIIPTCARADIRAVAPDLVGFGRSDKPARGEDYTYQRHVDWVFAVITALNLRNIVLLCHDWGGLIGLRLVADHPERFAGVVATNTSLPTGDRMPPSALVAWQRCAERDRDFAPGSIIQRACVRPLPPETIAAYDAPFPEDSYKAGVRRLPMLVPTSPDDPASAPNRQAWASLASFRKPFLTVFGDRDPFTAGAERAFHRKIPGALGQSHVTLSDVGHFLQEDASDQLGSIVTSFVQACTAR